MKRRMPSLHLTRWLRVIALVGIVWASAPAIQQDPAQSPSTVTPAPVRTANAWCSRC